MQNKVAKLAEKGVVSPRLIMRPFRIEDAEDMFCYTSDEESCKFLSWGPHIEVTETISFLERAINSVKKAEDIHWGLYLAETNRLIGSVHIYETDFLNEALTISYMLNPKFARQGYMSECLTAVIKECQSFLNMKIFYADIADDNVSSRRVAEKIGMCADTNTSPWHKEIKGKNYKHQRYVLRLT